MIVDLTTVQNAKGWIDLGDKPVTGITQANPAVVTCANHNFRTGRQVVLFGIGGMVQVNGMSFTVTVVDANSFSIGVDSTHYNAYTSGGFVGVDDVLLARLITAVSGWIGLETYRNFASQTYTEAYNGKGSNRLMLKNRPITAISSVVVDGVTILPAAGPQQTGYLFDDDMVYLNGYSFSRGFQNVRIAYTAGLAAGDPVLMLAEQVCIRLVALAYNEKSRTGQQTKTLAGEVVSFSLKDLPDDVARMLWRLRRVAPV